MKPAATVEAPLWSLPEGGVGVVLPPSPAGALAEPDDGGCGTPPGVDGDGA